MRHASSVCGGRTPMRPLRKWPRSKRRLSRLPKKVKRRHSAEQNFIRCIATGATPSDIQTNAQRRNGKQSSFTCGCGPIFLRGTPRPSYAICKITADIRKQSQRDEKKQLNGWTCGRVRRSFGAADAGPVSYTHLTLPT